MLVLFAITPTRLDDVFLLGFIFHLYLLIFQHVTETRHHSSSCISCALLHSYLHRHVSKFINNFIFIYLFKARTHIPSGIRKGLPMGVVVLSFPSSSCDNFYQNRAKMGPICPGGGKGYPKINKNMKNKKNANVQNRNKKNRCF